MGVDPFFTELLGGADNVDPGSVAAGPSPDGVADDNDELNAVENMEDDGIAGRNTQQAPPDKGVMNPEPSIETNQGMGQSIAGRSGQEIQK